MEIKKLFCFTLNHSKLYYRCMTQREIEKLFKTHYTRMFRLAISILYDEDESKDVVSEVFSHLLINETPLREDTAEAYLLMSVRNQCRNVLKRKQVRERFLHLFSEEATMPTIANGEQIQMKELMQYIEKELSPLNQQIFHMRYQEEMTCQEVANALGISRMTVHTHLRESIKHVRMFFSHRN